MATRNQEKRERIFKLFVQNLNWVKEHDDVSFVPDFTDGYICPICFDPFFEKDLNVSLNNPLTLEDIPPASLGGKAMALTCKSCNSKNGRDLDAHLLNGLLGSDSKSFLPNSESNASFEIDGNKVHGTFAIDANGAGTSRIEPSRSHPKQYKYFVDKMQTQVVTKYNPLFYPDKIISEESHSPKFNMKFQRNYNERRGEVALLRIAYLLAFSTFGNGFLISGPLYKVREQILNPEKVVLPGRVYWLKVKFPKEMEGINIIREPKELQSFLVIFNLKTKSNTLQCAIILPGPSSPGIDVYKFMEDQFKDGGRDIPMMLHHILDKDFLKVKDYAFASHLYWQRYTDPEFKPSSQI